MKCQALTKDKQTRAYFEIYRITNGVHIKTPDGQEYILIFEQVLDALGLDILKSIIYGEKEK